ncbi:VWA domain-containing protein [Nocardioides sp. CN2-186]|uniref:vWA domain-containing protein n=1 Tax=Nocardioides tweenelious TaxID=3156607 RepID=UPI0032B4E337
MLVNALLAALRPRSPERRSLRPGVWHRGKVDAARTVRASMRRMGEPAQVVYRRRLSKPRRVVLIIDVSGSMSGYAEHLLRLAHRVTHGARGSVETFTIGTRLTHLTRALRARDTEQALGAAGSMMPDWSGGTRLGENLQAFLDRWGRRGMARGSVIVIFSDGWESGETALLAEQTESLARLSHRLVWVNPHRGKTGYEPLQQGVKAVLPYVSDFLAGHSLATYEDVLDVIANA